MYQFQDCSLCRQLPPRSRSETYLSRTWIPVSDVGSLRELQCKFAWLPWTKASRFVPRSFHVSGLVVWNSLPKDICNQWRSDDFRAPPPTTCLGPWPRGYGDCFFLAGPFSPTGPPRSRGLRGPCYATVCNPGIKSLWLIIPYSFLSASIAWMMKWLHLSHEALNNESKFTQIVLCVGFFRSAIYRENRWEEWSVFYGWSVTRIGLFCQGISNSTIELVFPELQKLSLLAIRKWKRLARNSIEYWNKNIQSLFW